MTGMGNISITEEAMGVSEMVRGYEKVVKVHKTPYTKKKFTETLYFCLKCGQGFCKPKKHYLDINSTIKCK